MTPKTIADGLGDDPFDAFEICIDCGQDFLPRDYGVFQCEHCERAAWEEML